MRLFRFSLIAIWLWLGIFPSFSAEYPYRTDFYADSDKTFGSRIKTPFIETRFSVREEEDRNFGITFSTRKLFPDLALTIKTGNLSAGGSLSRLNNPTLSNGTSPFSSSISEPDFCTASLPGYTSFSKVPSLYFLAELPPLFKKTITTEVSCFSTPDSASPVTSILTSAILFKRSLKIRFSSTAGIFPYNDNTSSSWFLNEAYYQQGTHFCAINEFSIEAGRKTKLFTGFTAAYYESPFGTLPLNLRLDIKFSSTHMDIYTSGFYNPDDGIITSSQKSIPSCLQFKGGFLIKSLMGKASGNSVLVKTGINVFSTIKLMQLEHPLRINAGLQMSSARSSFSLSSSVNFTLTATEKKLTPGKTDFTGISLQAKDTWYFKFVDIGAAVSAGYTPQENDTISSKYKFTLNASSNTPQKISGTASLSLTSNKDFEFQKKVSAALSVRLYYKFVYFTGKLSYSADLP